MFWRNGTRRAGGSRGLWVGGALAAVAIGGLVLTGAARAAGGTAGAEPAGGSAAAVEYQVSAAGQRAAVAYWTPARLAAAQAEALPQAAELPDVSPPKGTPTATHFTGVPTVGALVSSTSGKSHFCTASVADSTAGDLIVAAAHCVWEDGPATNIAYVPEYHNKQEPYGAWAASDIYVAPGWASINPKTGKPDHDPDLDFAFLALAPVKGREIQAVTGGLRVGILLGYLQKIEVIGYNDTDNESKTLNEPVECKTISFKFRTNQMEFYCDDYNDGTSGGPWIIGYNAKTGTGTVFGVIGGYEQGGDYSWASYSAYFGVDTRNLLEAAEKAQSATSSPTHTPSPSQSPTATSTPSARSAAYPAPGPAQT